MLNMRLDCFVSIFLLSLQSAASSLAPEGLHTNTITNPTSIVSTVSSIVYYSLVKGPYGNSTTLSLSSVSTSSGLRAIATGSSPLTANQASQTALPSEATVATASTIATATSVTRTPAITPPATSSPGAIPNTVPVSGPPEPQVAITFQGETFVLPHTVSIELLQSDGSTATLFSNSVVLGVTTVSIPPLASQTTLSSGDLSIEAGPESRGSPTTGGATGFDGLVNALKGLAGTANSIVDTLDQINGQGVQWSAGSLSDSAFSSSVDGLFDSAIADLSSFASSMTATFDDMNSEVYELTEDGLRKIFPALTGGVEELDLLRSLRKLLRGITGLRKGVITKLKDYWIQGTAAAAALAAAEEALRSFGCFDWAAVKPQSSSIATTSSNATGTINARKSTTTTSSSSNSATPTQYMLTTNDGTALSTFQSYIKTLPDKGNGYQITFPTLTWQSYFTNLTYEQAQDVANQNIVNYVTLINELNDTSYGAASLPSTIKKRVASNENLQDRPDSDQHLQVLSVANQVEVNDILGAALPEYLFDPLLGAGQTIYIIDTGFNMDHVEFSARNGRTVTPVVVPNDLMLAKENKRELWGPGDMWDIDGHGTKVASVAGGITHGVASRADLVLVKYKNAAKNPYNPTSGKYIVRGATELAVRWAWDWIINDVNQKRANGNMGKFIINYSAGISKVMLNLARAFRWTDRCIGLELEDLSSPGGASGSSGKGKEPLREGFKAIMEDVISRCWASDIITVVATGNDGADGVSLDRATPQILGTATNGLITVGGVNSKGQLAQRTTFDAGRGGSITVYAVSEKVKLADWEDVTGTLTDSGTSFAAPAVAGLAAYFASLPSLAGQFPQGSVSTAMKDYIVKYAYRRLPLDGDQTPIPANLPSCYSPIPAADSIRVAYNRAPEGLCSTNAPAKRAVGMVGRPGLMARQSSAGDQDVVVSGTIVASGLSQSYCSIQSTVATSSMYTSSTALPPSSSSSSSASVSSHPSTSASTLPTVTKIYSSSSTISINTAAGASGILSIFQGLSSTSSSSTTSINTAQGASAIISIFQGMSTSSPSPTSFTAAFPTISSAFYCTEVLSDGHQVLHPESSSVACTFNTVEPTSSTVPPAPTINTDDGILTCGTRTDQGNAEYFFTQGDANNAMYQFCHNMTVNSPPIVFKPGGNTYEYGTYTFVDNPDPLVTVSARWGALDDSGCPTLDMSKDTTSAYDLCKDRLSVIINGCDTKEVTTNLFWKQGGKFFRDCITWELMATVSYSSNSK